MSAPTHPIIVIGSSAGGWEALPVILENLPEDLPASVFVVQHLSSESMGEAFLNHLNKRSVLPCGFVIDQEPIRPGRVYLAPPDYHLLLTQDSVRVVRGARENGFRPSVDTMFRSAAAKFGATVIGVILSGMRDDGVEGISAIHRSGGFTVVQDPANSPYPDMPQAVLARITVDYKVSTQEMGLVLSGLVFRPTHPDAAIPQDVLNEASIAERVLTSIDSVEEIASHTPYTCPACGGVLYDVNHGGEVHSYRCHAGHAYSPDSLFHFKSAEVEEALWAALRFLEEQKRMLQKLPINRNQLGLDKPTTINKRLTENQRYIDLLRAMLLGNDKGNGNGNGQKNGYHS